MAVWSGAEARAASKGDAPCPRAVQRTPHLHDAAACDAEERQGGRPRARPAGTVGLARRSAGARCLRPALNAVFQPARQQVHRLRRAPAGYVGRPRTPSGAMLPRSRAASWAYVDETVGRLTIERTQGK